MTTPVIIPAARPLPHQHRAEPAAWFADKLREAWELGPDNDLEIDWQQSRILALKVALRVDAINPPRLTCAACGQSSCEHPDPVFAGLTPPPPRVAQPNYAALGLGSAEEAEGRN